MAESPIPREEGRSGGLPVATQRALLAAVLAWLLPGAGHAFLGRKGRGFLFAALVIAAWVFGAALDGAFYRPTPGQPLSILGALAELGAGLAYAMLFLSGFSGDATAPGFEYGKAFLITAGLMNYLLVLDAWDIALGRKS